MSPSSSGSGAAVDAQAHLGAAAARGARRGARRYAATARALGAATITFMGTEPIRRAGDAARIVAEVEAATGVPLHVLTHEEEAYLTLIGVTAGRPVEHETLVVDIGGGSSEFCAVAAGGDRAGRGPAPGLRSPDMPASSRPTRRRRPRSPDAGRRRRDPRRRATRRADRPRGRRRDGVEPAQGHDRRGRGPDAHAGADRARRSARCRSTPTDALTERFFDQPEAGPAPGRRAP